MHFLRSHVPLPAKVFLLDHLRVMLRGGIPIGRALGTLADDAPSPALATMLHAVREAVERGAPFSDSIAQQPGLLPPVTVELLRAGEQSGTLEHALSEVAAQLRKEHDLRTRIQGALLYPAIIMGAMGLLAIGVVTYILPRLLVLFREVTVPLPLPTRVLLAVASFAPRYGWIVGLAIAAGVAGAVAYARSDAGELVWHRILLGLPGRLGRLSKEVNLSRMLRTLAGLLATDVPIVRALELTGATLGNVLYRRTLIEAATRVGRGEALSTVLRTDRKRFPPTAVQVIAVGEETGTLGEVLVGLADFYEGEVDRALRNFATIIEPILILLIGVGVAYLAVAVLLPMYSIARAI